MSPEALIEALQTVEVDNNNTFLKKSCEGFAIVDELVNFLNKKAYENGMATILTSFFDCKDVFEYKTKSRGTELLKDICFGILGGTTLDLIRKAIPQDSVGAGLTSRIIFVYTESRPVPVSRCILTEEQKRIKSSIVEGLSTVAQYSGEVIVSEEAWKFFDERYNYLFEHSDFYNNPLLRGYASRRHNHLLSTAICLSAAELKPPRMNVEKYHIEGADMLLNELEKGMPEVLSLIAANDKGDIRKEVLDYIVKNKRVSRSALLSFFTHKVDSFELSQITTTLIQARKIKTSMTGSDIVYSTHE
jgi:hypothetical protein